MAPLPLLIRAAVRLKDVCSTRAACAVETGLHERLRSYEQHRSRIGEALRNTEPATSGTAPASLARQLRSLVQAVEQAVRPTCRHLQERQVKLPDLRSVLAELRQLDDEFGGLEINLKQKTLWVSTERIVLKDVDLGPFAIELSWSKLVGASSSLCFGIEELDPCPASARDDDVTHPHVQRGVLCPGEATVPIQKALESGRLADAFLLVRSVLTHYNPSSAYVALHEWDSEECSDCGCRRGDGLSSCDRCGDSYCSDCIGACNGCDSYLCSSCEVACAICGERFCPSCLSRCRFSGKNCCESCRHDCSSCGVAVAEDRIDEPTGRCPSCVLKENAKPTAPADSASPCVNEPVPIPEITKETTDVSNLVLSGR